MVDTFTIRPILGGFYKLVGIAIFILIASLIYFEEIYIFSLLLALNFIAIVAYEAVDINLNQNTYRKYLCILGFKMGSKQPLPAIDYVLIKDNTHYRINSFGNKEFEACFEVSLVCANNYKIPLNFTHNKQKAIKVANAASKQFTCSLNNQLKD